MKFKVGDKVKLNPEIKKFKYGRGGVGYEEIGTITKIDKYLDIDVDFPTLDWWNGTEDELILVSKNSKKTFFKKLPNDYTGILEVKNGYIVEKEILDEVEKEYLLGIIKPFKKNVKYIEKLEECTEEHYEFIHFYMNRYKDNFSLPIFKNGIMYKGMELGKEYTLKELGLDE